ncbi:unnamed protein product, partial [Hymenolepis diminuta]
MLSVPNDLGFLRKTPKLLVTFQNSAMKRTETLASYLYIILSITLHSNGLGSLIVDEQDNQEHTKGRLRSFSSPGFQNNVLDERHLRINIYLA